MWRTVVGKTYVGLEGEICLFQAKLYYVKGGQFLFVRCSSRECFRLYPFSLFEIWPVVFSKSNIVHLYIIILCEKVVYIMFAANM